MKLDEALIVALVDVERVLVRHSESDDHPPRADRPEYSVRRAVRSEFREKRERLLEGLDSDARVAHWAIARAVAEAAEWREYAVSLARPATPATAGAQLALGIDSDDAPRRPGDPDAPPRRREAAGE